jgi:hypothetical protein
MSARQARYDELTHWDPYDSDALDLHKKVTERINIEESSPEFDGVVRISVSTYIKDDIVYQCSYGGTGREDRALFDLK